ncbi:MAG: ScpA family protein [Gammaproteobacteria bacterium]
MTEEIQNNHQPQQQEMPFAVVQGTPISEVPKDLYIPPDALEVFLAESFEGPLDLLLYLIKRQNLNILDIPIADITAQYMEYVEMMTELRLELAAEYLVMAAMLAEIKSRMLLPRPVEEDMDEEDPRAELVRRLQEYERFKQAAEDVDNLPRVGRDVFPAEVQRPDLKIVREPPSVEMKDIMMAFADVLKRASMYEHHHIQMEPLSVRERMSRILSKVKADHFTDFSELFTVEEGRSGVVVSLLAILELIKQSLIELVQTEAYGPIHVKAVESAKSE